MDIRTPPDLAPCLQRDLRYTATMILDTYSSSLRNKKACAAVLQHTTPPRILSHPISHVSTPGINIAYLRGLPRGIAS